MTVEEIRAAMRATGYTVRTISPEHTAEQTFQTEAARDEYMARAKRLGVKVEIVAR